MAEGSRSPRLGAVRCLRAWARSGLWRPWGAAFGSRAWARGFGARRPPWGVRRARPALGPGSLAAALGRPRPRPVAGPRSVRALSVAVLLWRRSRPWGRARRGPAWAGPPLRRPWGRRARGPWPGRVGRWPPLRRPWGRRARGPWPGRVGRWLFLRCACCRPLGRLPCLPVPCCAFPPSRSVSLSLLARVVACCLFRLRPACCLSLSLSLLIQ